MANSISQVQQRGRRYLGEEVAEDIISYINSLSAIPFRQKKFVRLLRKSQVIEAANEARTLSDRRAKRWGAILMAEIDDALDEGEQLERTSHGWAIRPQTLRGKATLGIFDLWDDGRLWRVKECEHCRDWFYARFKHQRFCNDKQKKCQWNYYHTPEWRKRNRERNKRHQQQYRDRLFGKKARRKS